MAQGGISLFLVRPKSSFNHQYLGASPPLIASITRNGSIRAGACLIIGHTQESKTHKSGTQWFFFNLEHGELWWMDLDGFGWVRMGLGYTNITFAVRPICPTQSSPCKTVSCCCFSNCCRWSFTCGNPKQLYLGQPFRNIDATLRL